MTYATRLAVLVGIAVLASAIDRVVHGPAATRWKEYGLVCLGGLLGAGFGAVHDAVTVRISPEYFSLGKDLGVAPGLAGRAAWLGAQAGLSAGAVLTALLLGAATAGARPRAPLRRVARAWMAPAALALPSAAIGALLGRLASRHASPISGFSSEAHVCFYTVWGIHIGTYLGGLLGALVVGIGIWRQRARLG